jgi:hypothetical protein
MSWFYVDDGTQTGPVSDDELSVLISDLKITKDTLIWREGMSDWVPYGNLDTLGSNASVVISTANCHRCGNEVPTEDAFEIVGKFICADCKPAHLQEYWEDGKYNRTDAETTRLEYLRRESSIRSFGTFSCIVGVLAFFINFKLTGTIFILLGLGMRSLHKWARIPTLVLAGIGLLSWPIGTLLNAYILYLLLSPKGEFVFSDEYHKIILDSPNIRSRTSNFLKFVYVLLLALVALFCVILFFFSSYSSR